MKRLVAMICLLALLPAAKTAAREHGPAADLAAARALFEANLEAIRQRDRQAYVACYLDSEHLARVGPEGPALGYAGLLEAAGESWPDHFEAQDLRLVPVAPGVVYGTYRYRVRYGVEEQAGLSERLFLRSEDGSWRIAVTTAFPAPPGTPPPPRALVGATLIDGTGRPPVEDAVVLTRGGRVECAGSRRDCPVPDGVASVDLGGLYITPGLIDAHVHFAQTGWADGRPDALDVRDLHPYEATQADLREHPERFFRAWLCSGVTAVFDVGGYPWTLDLPARAAATPLAPHVVAAGPLLSTLDHWLNLPAERQFLYLGDAEAARAGTAYLAERGASAAKVWFIAAPDRPMAEMAAAVAAAGEAARRRGLPLIVHATGLEEAKEALRAGAHLLVHSVWDREVDEEFLALARQGGTLYCPTLTVARGYLRLFEAVAAGEVPAVDDPNGCLGAATRARLAATATLGAERVAGRDPERRAESLARREAIMAANLRRVAEAGIPIAMGTDAGNPLTLHGPSVYAEMEAMQAAGLSAMEVLVAATRGGAAALGRGDEMGTVEAGKVADLLVLAADPSADIAHLRQLRYVARGGVLRSLEELREPAP